ncbi:PREDICTED: uncharacterized protein LOC106116750 isoform X2 [Papilio xuthus]|uniref:Uncharacterized protein LOC106116750 isoform X2 n=1 Tax=Papilio xuthus TaxID=66420 RepID=A0AAJ6Z6B8_PAPXU|nr:PREDICTED: uncharacterized protein LOC106116750 isoform X2 [Papilio xuthus]
MSAMDAPDKGAVPSNNTKPGLKRLADDQSVQRPDPKKSTSPSESIQSVYTKPGYENDANVQYGDNDKGPFTVYISRQETDPTSGYSLKTLKVAQLLHKHNVPGIVEGGIKEVGRNKISVTFEKPDHANSLLQNPILANCNLVGHIPRFHVFRLGIVRNIPTEWTLEELLSGISTPSNCGEVIKARRLNFKSRREDSTTWVPSNTVVLTFTGQCLPEKIFCFNVSLPVSVYHLPTIQCRNCCRFGHIAKQCRSKPRCFRCAQPHSGDSCNISDSISSCFLCHGGRHVATDPKCPEHSRQKSIKILMSEENLSYMEASKRFPHVRTLYADIAASPTAPTQNVSYPTVSSSPRPASTSYTKTLFLPPRPKPALTKSYDFASHNSIVQTPTSCQSNGCAFTSPSDPCPIPTPNDNLVELLLCSLINMFSKLSDSPLPSNVSVLAEQLIALLAKNSQQIQPPNSPMEL